MIVLPGYSGAKIAAIIAIIESRFTSLPSDKTALILSTSVSKIKPKSALLFKTAVLIASIAALFSGFGI